MRKAGQGPQTFHYKADYVLMQCKRACNKFRRDEVEDMQELVTEFQGSYRKFKENLALKEKSSSQKSSQKSAKTSRRLQNDVSEQKCALS